MALYTEAFKHEDLSSYKVLLTGGAGFIGSNLVEYMLAHGVGHLRVMDNLETGFEENLTPFMDHPNFEFMNADIRDDASCKKAMEDRTVVLHQAALGSVPRSIDDPQSTNAVNIDGFLNVLNAARLAGVKRFVFASSSSIYGDDQTFPKQEAHTGNPLSPYAVTKQTNELYANVFASTYGMEVIGLRYFNVFGPNQSPEGAYAAVVPIFVKQMMMANAPAINGDGTQTRDFTFIHNVVQANMLAMTSSNSEAPNNMYNVACGGRLSVLELFEAVRSNLDIDLTPKFNPSRAGEVMHSYADISKAQNNLGYNPVFDVNEGLQQTINYFKEKFSSFMA